MPHVTELASALQTALQKYSVRIGVRCIFDADDLNIDLSNYLNMDAPVNIQKAISILPYGTIGRYQVGEVTLRMINKDDYFNHTNSSSPFYYASARIISAKGSSDTSVALLKGDGAKFADVSKITLGQGGTATTFTIASVDTSDPNEDVVNFTASGSVAYASGTVIETVYLPGRKVTLKTIVENETTEITQFVGILKGHPKINAEYAEITIYDPIKQLLDVELEATSSRIMNDTIVDTLEYNREDASTGTLDNAQIDVNFGCPIGEWQIVFADATNFTIYAPTGEEQSGDTSSDMFFPTGAGTYWVTIETGAWASSFEAGDKIKFQTVCALGPPLYSAAYSIPAFLKTVITAEFGADLPVTEINETAFDSLITYYDEMFGQITFTENTTVLKAIELIQQTINASVFPQNDGKIGIFTYRPRYDDGSSFPVLSPDTDIREVDMSDLGRIDTVIAHWNYSHPENTYLNKLIIPDAEASRLNAIEIKLPAAYSEAIARSAAERLWIMWRKGVRAYQISEKFNYGVAWELGDIFRISSDHPSIPSRVVVVYELQKDLRNGEVVANCYDLNYAFANFLVLDSGHKLDNGKVLW